MKIGLVLSGGMAKGAYHIGALRALEHFIPKNEIKYISGASVGALSGYAYATGNLARAEEAWRNLCEDDTRLIISRVLRSSALQQSISTLCDFPKKLSAHCYCSLLDLNHRNLVYQDLSTVDPDLIPRYLKASVAMPVYNRSVQVDGNSYFDGAIIDNIPVFPLLKHRLDYIICIYFDDICYQFENTHFDNRIIKITFPSQSILKQSVLFGKDNIESMIEEGYDRTMHLLRSVFSAGYENLDSIYQAIDYMNRTSSRTLRITGDMLVTNLNKITQKLTKRKML